MTEPVDWLEKAKQDTGYEWATVHALIAIAEELRKMNESVGGEVLAVCRRCSWAGRVGSVHPTSDPEWCQPIMVRVVKP